MKQHKNTCFSSCPDFFEIYRKVPAFFVQNCGKFIKFKTPDPRAKKVEQKPDPRGSENMRIPGGHPEGMVRLGIDLYIKPCIHNTKLVINFAKIRAVADGHV